MSKILSSIIFLLFLHHCSFDNKTGIWTDGDYLAKESIKKENNKKKLTPIFSKKENFKKEVKAPNLFDYKFSELVKNINWTQEYYNDQNNLSNIFYENFNNIIFKSSKISKRKLNKNIYFIEKNFIYSDIKGTIYVYSLEKKKITYKYNFYKKKYKKFNIKVNLIIYENVIYAADNLVYIYAINYQDKKILWAKNYGTPFLSNLKKIGDQILLSNQDNKMYSIDIYNGDNRWSLLTDNSVLKTTYKNNLVLDYENNLIFLNANGSLYSIDLLNKKLNWTLNFRPSLNYDSNNLFYANPLTINDNEVLVSTNNNLSLHNTTTGAQIWSRLISSQTKPIFSNEVVYILSDSNLLICIDKVNGNTIWSKNIFSQFASSKKNKIINKINKIKYFYLTSNKLLLISKNGYVMEFNPKRGSLTKVNKLLNKPYLEPLFANGNLYILNNSKKIIGYN